MPKETITLSRGELDRVSVIEVRVDRRLRQCQAARQQDNIPRQQIDHIRRKPGFHTRQA